MVIVICRLQERGAISPAKMQFDAHDRSYAPRIPFGCDINTDRYLFGREARDYCIINLITAPVPRPSLSLSLSLFMSLSGSPVSPLSKPPRPTRTVASLHRSYVPLFHTFLSRPVGTYKSSKVAKFVGGERKRDREDAARGRDGGMQIASASDAERTAHNVI